VTYVPGGSAVPIIKPYPPFEWPRTWTQWYFHRSQRVNPGIAVYYNDGPTTFLQLGNPENPARIIPDFVPPDFDAKGQMFRQLTPDEPIP